MRSSPPPQPFDDLSDAELIKKLCIALRDVGLWNEQLPDGIEARSSICSVKEIHSQILGRELDVSDRLVILHDETGWDVECLYRKSLAYPSEIPYLDKYKVGFCGECGDGLPDNGMISLCLKCVQRGIESDAVQDQIDECLMCGRHDKKGFVIYAFGEDWRMYCRECLSDQQKRYSAR